MLAVPIFVTGFMGAGKSRVGRLLARRLGRAFLDTDEMVEARAGKPIARIFAEDGEDRFRAMERDCVAMAARADAVVALGGGAILDPCTLALVLRTGVLAWIEVDVDTILQRVGRRDDRPLLAGLDPAQRRARVESLLAARLPWYQRAHVRVRSGAGSDPEDTALALQMALEDWCAHHPRTAG